VLTKRRKQVLDFIRKYLDKHEYAPALEEIKNHFHLASVSTAHYHVQSWVFYIRKLISHAPSMSFQHKNWFRYLFLEE